MKAKVFCINDRKQAQTLSKQMEYYRRNKAMKPVSLFSLGDVYDLANQYQEPGRISTALFDLYLYTTELELCIDEIAKRWNEDVEYRRNSSDSILFDSKFLEERMALHRMTTEYTLRHRAAWDKLMGIIVLLISPEKYNEYFKKKEKLKTFKKIVENWDEYGEELADDINSLVSTFNNRFRTAEAHDFGVWRKWAFVVQDGEEDPQADLIKAHNLFLKHLGLIQYILKQNKHRSL